MVEIILDQHFLIDKRILKRILELAELNKKETVLEIGAGKGNLTKLLAKKAKKVCAIEKDESLFNELKKLNKNIKPILGDALKIEFPRFDKIISNIPYSISEPLIQKLLYHNFKLGVLLVSEKFSRILTGKKRTKLSLISETFFEVEPCDLVSPENFKPKPKVYSRIIILKPKKPSLKDAIFQEFIKQRDKKAKNALREAIIKASSKFGRKVTKREARKIIGDFKIDKKVQNLNLKELEKIKSLIKILNL
jgi:16S rRNA (adenine1518-N6/adenine1519-N6)-dimethyltransferase